MTEWSCHQHLLKPLSLLSVTPLEDTGMVCAPPLEQIWGLYAWQPHLREERGSLGRARDAAELQSNMLVGVGGQLNGGTTSTPRQMHYKATCGKRTIPHRFALQDCTAPVLLTKAPTRDPVHPAQHETVKPTVHNWLIPTASLCMCVLPLIFCHTLQM